MKNRALPRVAIVGGGPTGLRAAEVIASGGGVHLDLFEATRSVGRKFLIAGKSGLNLTHQTPFPPFLEAYRGTPPWWPRLFDSFCNDELRAWARGLGVETYVASSGKVFPTGMKAAPLLRRLVQNVRNLGGQIHPQHYWADFTPLPEKQGTLLHFRDQSPPLPYDFVLFALGGGSWKKTGSDGQWVAPFRARNIAVAPLGAANCGWETNWPADFLATVEGLPLKNIVLHAGAESRAGELVITRYGLEGGPIYHLGAALRSLPEPKVTLDLKPSFTAAQLTAKMESAKRHLLSEAAIRWRLSPAQKALLETQVAQDPVLGQGDLPPSHLPALAAFAKAVPLSLTQPRPLEEAISSAGGVEWGELDETLMLTKYPGIYCAGEMLNWEAPTGGYLLQAAFTMGTYVGEQIKKHLEQGSRCLSDSFPKGK